jgi:hypothetical protein
LGWAACVIEVPLDRDALDGAWWPVAPASRPVRVRRRTDRDGPFHSTQPAGVSKKKKSTGWRDGAGGIGGTAPVPVAAPVRYGIAMHGPHVSVSSGHCYTTELSSIAQNTFSLGDFGDRD